eukprot:TRINITY_DN12236_c0_g1_i1.p2 TRINITY_DN12236_c0_g1~~TRINITY_DN12236_c0_g1_i1.p2  ORF type:complete len:149 (+),score=9.80 TRINITY_DN12236_c0_g1_i1:249-695(+)
MVTDRRETQISRPLRSGCGCLLHHKHVLLDPPPALAAARTRTRVHHGAPHMIFHQPLGTGGCCTLLRRVCGAPFRQEPRPRRHQLPLEHPRAPACCARTAHKRRVQVGWAPPQSRGGDIDVGTASGAAQGHLRETNPGLFDPNEESYH